MKTYIFVSFDFEGFHCWPDAPDARAFLRSLHRHVFKCKVTVEVKHDDRQIEFFDLKTELTKAAWIENPSDSCETIARRIFSCLKSRGYMVTTVVVTEDGENGAIIEQ